MIMVMGRAGLGFKKFSCAKIGEWKEVEVFKEKHRGLRINATRQRKKKTALRCVGSLTEG